MTKSGGPRISVRFLTGPWLDFILWGWESFKCLEHWRVETFEFGAIIPAAVKRRVRGRVGCSRETSWGDPFGCPG